MTETQDDLLKLFGLKKNPIVGFYFIGKGIKNNIPDDYIFYNSKNDWDCYIEAIGHYVGPIYYRA